MRGTFTTPWGKLRCGSTRRYVLVCNYGGAPSIIKRSDNPDTLRRDRTLHRIIIDTSTGETVT